MGMDADEVIDREVLLAAGLDPDDPQVWVIQHRVRDLLICLGILRASQIDPQP
ncbi:hypothetical protein ACWEVD_01490 [Nocardia thailandica]